MSPRPEYLEIYLIPNWLLLATLGGVFASLCLLMLVLAFLNFRRSPRSNERFVYTCVVLFGLGFLTAFAGGLQYHLHEKPLSPGLHLQPSVYATDPGKLSAWSQRLYGGNLSPSSSHPGRLTLSRGSGESLDNCSISYGDYIQPTRSGLGVPARLECNGRDLPTIESPRP